MNNISGEQKYGVEGPGAVWSGRTSPSRCEEKNPQDQNGTWNEHLVSNVTKQTEVEDSDNEEDGGAWKDVDSVVDNKELQSTTSSLKSFRQVNQTNTPPNTVKNLIESIDGLRKEEESREKPQQKIIDKLIEAKDLHLTAIDVLNNIDDPNRENRASYLHQLGIIRFFEAKDAQRDTPRKEVMDPLREAGQSYQKAIAALDSTSDPTSSVQTAFDLAEEGSKFLSLALKVNQFRQIKHDKLNRTNYDQRFVKPLQADYQLAANSLLSVIEEEKNKANPRQDIIDKFIKANKLHLQAVDALNNIDDFNRENRASYLNQLGVILFFEAKEAQRDTPRKEVMDPLREAGQSYQKAIAALDSTSDPTSSVQTAFELAEEGSKLLALALKVNQFRQRIR
jgi:hypothetical protein